MQLTNFEQDFEKLLKMLPNKYIDKIHNEKREDVVELVFDLGRPPEIRFLGGQTVYMDSSPVSQEDIENIVHNLSEFNTDNRCGIEGTLHRISAIRNRSGKIIGITCRVGRVVFGTIDCIKDLVMDNKSILLLGRPGVGKTTKLREVARLLSEEAGKRVIVVDSSNEIGGDGDIPHPAIGKSRRMQVKSPEYQKEVMIEAVENHNPQVIIVDEIGTEAEALAARTIAERGVMLIATAHGITLENIVKNPMLADLIGGIESVTLSDELARKRGIQKTVLERAKKPTFDIIIELRDLNTLAVYKNVEEAVDCLLRGWEYKPDIRPAQENGDIVMDDSKPVHEGLYIVPEKPMEEIESFSSLSEDKLLHFDEFFRKNNTRYKDGKKVYVYAVSRSIVDKVIDRLDLPIEVTRTVDEADFVLALSKFAKTGSKIIQMAKSYGIPTYFVKANALPQVQSSLKYALRGTVDFDENVKSYIDETDEAIDEVREALLKVEATNNAIALMPRKSHIRRLQHEIIEKSGFSSYSTGEDDEKKIVILPKEDDNTEKNVG